MVCTKVNQIQSEEKITGHLKEVQSLIFEVSNPIVPSMYKRDKYSADNIKMPRTDDILRVVSGQSMTAFNVYRICE